MPASALVILQSIEATVTRSADLGALVQKTGIVQTSNLGGMIQKQNLTSAASLNALAQKAALTVPISLNAVLANITLLNRMTDVTLSGEPRVCISNSLYFKVFPTRAGSETPDVDRASWKTYDDSTLSGTPQKLGFAYAGSLYWVKGYTTPSATANPTGDSVQNVAFAVPDATLSGEESVFRIISGGDYYYFKAFLDTVLTLREVYTGASLDALLLHAQKVNLDALLKKEGVTVPVSLNAVLANITLLNRMTDVTLSGEPRVCISNSLYFKVFPTRAGSETPDVDRAAWKTYDDSTISGTPKRLGFAYAGSLYWVKGYPTPAGTGNPTGDSVQNVAFSVPDATLAGEESVFRIISGGDYYYFKAFLDTVITVQELYTGASLDAILALGMVTHTALAALDAMIAGGKISSANLDTLLKKTGLTGTANLNALLRKTGLTLAGSLDGLVKKTGLTGTASLNALVRKDGLTSAGSLDSKLAAVRSATASLNALLQKQGILTTASLNALIAKTYSVAGSLDALVRKDGIIRAGSLDSLVQKTGLTGTASLNALVRKDGLSRAASLNALLCAIHSVSASMGSLLQKQGIPQNTGLDAMIQREEHGGASLDALLQKVGLFKTAGLDSFLNKADIEATASLDALLMGLTGAFTSLDALLKKTVAATTGLDALLFCIQDLSFRACWNCRTSYMEDAQMFLEPERCPKCGAYPDDKPQPGATFDFYSHIANGQMNTGLIGATLPSDDLPLKVCRKCRTPYMEDAMMLEPDRCPKCGYYPDNISQREGDANYVESY